MWMLVKGMSEHVIFIVVGRPTKAQYIVARDVESHGLTWAANLFVYNFFLIADSV